LRFIESADRASNVTASQAAATIAEGATVLTHSRSSTVLNALLEAKQRGRSFDVVATESRPMLEGRSLAAFLVSKEIPVTLIADSAAASAMSRVDVVLLGADKLTASGVINKIGTKMIALAARECDLPVYALCDTSKFIREDYLVATAREVNSPNELWGDPPTGVMIENSYFEHTPVEYFVGIVTEEGLLSPDEARRRAGNTTVDQGLLDKLLSSESVK
jgi:translation initiation factor 2B subunit (eIF-2B alpha/beta/delta family)